MLKAKLFRTRYIAIVVLLMLMMTSAYAFANSNTVPASYAGEGTGSVSGYEISNIDYTLDTTDPTDIDQVDFDLDQSAEEVYIQLDSASGTWFSCTATGTSVTCDTSGSTVPVGSTFTELTVVAAQ